MERYLLQLSEKPNYWVCTDIECGIVCVFEEKNYNDNQKFTLLENYQLPDANAIAKVAREMGDWLRANHYDKIF